MEEEPAADGKRPQKISVKPVDAKFREPLQQCPLDLAHGQHAMNDEAIETSGVRCCKVAMERVIVERGRRIALRLRQIDRAGPNDRKAGVRDLYGAGRGHPRAAGSERAQQRVEGRDDIPTAIPHCPAQHRPVRSRPLAAGVDFEGVLAVQFEHLEIGEGLGLLNDSVCSRPRRRITVPRIDGKLSQRIGKVSGTGP